MRAPSTDGERASLKSTAREPSNRTATLSQQIAAKASHVRARLLFMFLDTACVIAAYSAAEIFYWRNVAPTEYGWHFAVFLLIVVTLTLVSNELYGLYGRVWRHAGLEEARQMVFSTATIAAVLALMYPIVRLAGFAVIHIGVVAFGLISAAAGMSLIRFHSRIFALQRGSRGNGLRLAIVGSRDAAAQAVREMLRHPDAGLLPVAVFDDDTSVHGKTLVSVPVVGSISDIPAATPRYMLQEVLLAIPRPSPETIAQVLKSAESAGIPMKVLPSMHDVVNGPTGMFAIRRARDPNIEDLLGRTPVATDLDGVRRSLEGRRVLVTGAGGSIGSEICRQVAGFDPARLVLLDHDETHLHDTVSLIEGPCHQALIDINDRDALLDAFERYQPEVVLHTAAHKHVPVLEEHPVEAARTNVFGTLNVLDASNLVGAGRFLLVSSDKAVLPSSVMGASKRVAERLLLSRSPQNGAYCAVRFGNVLGSRGSVIPTFARQIEAGGPVTVTDPRMTRFFMSVREAVQLVLQASLLSNGRDIFMLEMGDPVPIMDLARRMIELSGGTVGVDIDIKVTGMRRGEKLEEDLRESDEEVLSTEHPSIARLLPVMPPKEWFDSCLAQLAEATDQGNDERVRDLLFCSASSGEETEVVHRRDLANSSHGNHVFGPHLQRRHQSIGHRIESAGS